LDDRNSFGKSYGIQRGVTPENKIFNLREEVHHEEVSDYYHNYPCPWGSSLFLSNLGKGREK